jgi:hypothetical protein
MPLLKVHLGGLGGAGRGAIRVADLWATHTWSPRAPGTGYSRRVYAGTVYDGTKRVFECSHQHESMYAARQCASAELRRRVLGER